MKKSLLLFSIALSLGIYTYYSIEMGHKKAFDEDQARKELFDAQPFGELTGLKFDKVSIVKKDSRWVDMSSDYPVDGEKLKLILDTLGNLKVQQELMMDDLAKAGRETFFPIGSKKFSFIFQNGDVAVMIGKKLDYEQSFYVEVVLKLSDSRALHKFVLAYDSTPQTQPLSEDEYRKNPFKYAKLRAMLSVREDYFHDTHLFKSPFVSNEMLDFGNWKQVDVKNIRNRNFSIFPLQNKTSPLPPLGVAYNPDEMGSSLKRILKMQAASVYFPIKKENLKDEVGELVITGKTQVISLRAFKKYGSLEGNFVLPSFEQSIYEISNETMKLFFMSTQDFWEKRAIKSLPQGGPPLEENDDFIFEVSFAGGADFALSVPAGDNFAVHALKVDTMVPINNAFADLFNFLFKSGERVNRMDKDDEKEVKKIIFPLCLKYKDGKICLLFHDHEIIVYNLAKKLMFHYYVGSESPIALEKQDYFIAK